MIRNSAVSLETVG